MGTRYAKRAYSVNGTLPLPPLSTSRLKDLLGQRRHSFLRREHLEKNELRKICRQFQDIQDGYSLLCGGSVKATPRHCVLLC